MMNKFKIFVILLSFLVMSPALAYYNPGNPSGFVNDYANVISDNDQQALEVKLSSFEKESSNEIAVVIIPNLGEDTIENFAVELFADWKIGKAKNDNGVLLLVAIEDRQMRIEVGYGLEGALTDAQSFWIINNEMKPSFQAENYYQGIDKAVDKIIAATQGEYVPTENNTESSGSEGQDWEFIFWIGFFALMWVASILGRSKSWWAGGVLGGVIGVIVGLIKGFLFIGLLSMAFLIPFGLLFDFIVSKNYTKHKARGTIPWWIGGGRGGRGGSGGGFGGFGGGFSGGGGASGRW